MSILVREKGADGSLGPYTLLSKGADDVMFEKLRPDGDKSAEDDVTRHLATSPPSDSAPSCWQRRP